MIKSKVLNWVGSLGSALTVGLCPICIPAIGSFLSAIGMGFLVNESVLKPIVIVFILISSFGFYWSYKKEHKNVYPVVFGIFFGVGIYLSRYVFINFYMMYASIAGLLGISIWNLKLKKTANCGACESE
jgi:mercuric ion transport protein